MIYFIVAVEMLTWRAHMKRSTQQVVPTYVSAVSFGDEMRIKKFQHTPDKAKAHKFAKISAERVAETLRGPNWRLRGVSVESIQEESCNTN